MVMTDMSTHISQISFKVTFSGTSTRSKLLHLILSVSAKMVLEPMLASEKVNAISIKPFNKETIVFGIGLWDHDRTDVIYVNCKNEFDLLQKFIKYWRTEWFDIITGWNVNSFDITYLCNRIDRLMGENEHTKLSIMGSVKC